MTNGGQRPDPSGFRIENEMDLLFGRAHPNPTRVGCPPPELLKSLARRELPIDDPAYDHFAKCSPCYQELRALQQADAATAATLLRRLSRHHEPKPAFVAGTRERKEIRSLVDNLEAGSSQFLFHEVRPDFVVLDLLRSCGRADIVVEWL